MDTFFINFRDPLFGVIVFFFFLFILSFLSYWWGRYKSIKERTNLDSFLGSFESMDEKKLAQQINTGSLSTESWLIVAQSYEHQGNFEKSIEIYHALLTKYREPAFQKDVLLLLGKNYFKAGFLERSRQSFLQILSKSPRTPQALKYLILIYEQLQQFDKALEAMESLMELSPEIETELLYLKCRVLLQNHALDLDNKAQQLIQLYTQNHRLGYLIFEWLFTYRSSLAWQHFDQSLSERLSDVLWRLREEQIDLDIISRNTYLRELFTAKGTVDLAQSCHQFELDTLIALRRCGSSKATLQFEYSCNACNHVSFVPFHRCPNCHVIDSVSPVMSLTKERFEDSHAFQ